MTVAETPVAPAPAERQITLDPVGGLFHRRALAAENEAIQLADQVRALSDVVRRQQTLIDALNAEAAGKPKADRKKGAAQ